MKLIKRADIPTEERPFGRTVQKLLSHNFFERRDSMTIFLSFLPKCRLDYHYHKNTEEIILYPEGGSIEVNGERYKLQPWDGVLLEPGEVHGFDGEDRDVYCLALRFPDNEDKIPAPKK